MTEFLYLLYNYFKAGSCQVHLHAWLLICKLLSITALSSVDSNDTGIGLFNTYHVIAIGVTMHILFLEIFDMFISQITKPNPGMFVLISMHLS